MPVLGVERLTTRSHGNDLIRSNANLIELSARPLIFEFDIAAEFPAEFRQASLKGRSLGLSAEITREKSTHQHRDAPFLLARLCTCREWQCGPNGNAFDEIASSHCPFLRLRTTPTM
jgi:hypothetical protein